MWDCGQDVARGLLRIVGWAVIGFVGLIVALILSWYIGGALSRRNGQPATISRVAPQAKVHTDDALRRAAAHPTPTRSPESQYAAWVVVVLDQDGQKRAIIDQNIAGAPQGHVVVNGALLQELGISTVDVIGTRLR